MAHWRRPQIAMSVEVSVVFEPGSTDKTQPIAVVTVFSPRCGGDRCGCSQCRCRMAGQRRASHRRRAAVRCLLAIVHCAPVAAVPRRQRAVPRLQSLTISLPITKLLFAARSTRSLKPSTPLRNDLQEPLDLIRLSLDERIYVSNGYMYGVGAICFPKRSSPL